jgi:hypothetical protein
MSHVHPVSSLDSHGWQHESLLACAVYVVCRPFDRHAHMPTKATSAAIALVLANAAFNADACILAPLAWALSVASLLALAASLAAGLAW